MALSLPPFLTGPAVPLPGLLDRGAERWARLPWRLRAAVLIGLACFLVFWHTNQVAKATAALGKVQQVWVATETLTPGSAVAGKFKRTRVPEDIRPEAALSEEPSESPVLTIVAGTVATSVHFEGVDKAPSVPAGHRAIAIATTDADLFSPGSRVDLWDVSEDEPSVLVEQLIVVSVKAQRVIVGVPEASASLVVQRASSNHLRVAPAGAATTTSPGKTGPVPSASVSERSPSATPGTPGGSEQASNPGKASESKKPSAMASDGVVPPTPSAGAVPSGAALAPANSSTTPAATPKPDTPGLAHAGTQQGFGQQAGPRGVANKPP